MALFEALEIRQHQFGFHRLGVTDRIDRALDMGHFTFEASQDVHDGIGLADIGEELVAKTFAFAGAADQAGDVDEFQLGGHDLRRFAEERDLVEARIRYRHTTDIRFDRAERVIRGLGGGRRGQCIEQGGLANIRQADNAAIKTHDGNPCCSMRSWPARWQNSGVEAPLHSAVGCVGWRG